MTVNREYSQQSHVFEFPISFEDEQEIYTENGQSETMLDKLPKALDLADRIAQYGGIFVLLIHPNVLDDKLEFLKQFIPAVKERAWFGTLAEFGKWWAARDAIEVDVLPQGNERIVRLNVPDEITGLTLHVSPTYRLQSTDPPMTVTQFGNKFLMGTMQGRIDLTFTCSQNASNINHFEWY